MIMNRIGPFMLAAIVVGGAGGSAFLEAPPRETKEQQSDIVSGILQELDLSQMKGKIKTDLGKPVFSK